MKNFKHFNDNGQMTGTITLTEVLVEQTTLKGRGCALYGIQAADIRDAVIGELALNDADYTLRIKDRQFISEGSSKPKLEHFAIKDGKVYTATHFSPEGKSKGSGWCWEIVDTEASKKVMASTVAYAEACDTYHKANPTDSRIAYDCFTWFKGSNVVITAPNFTHNTTTPKAAVKVITYKSIAASL